MSFTANKNMITAAFVQQFHDGFEIATQQKDSRFQGSVKDRGMITGASFTINDMGTVEMHPRTQRFGDTVWDVPEAGTRNVIMADYDLHIPVEPTDVPKLLAQPQGEYMNATVAAANRTKDRIIYAALLGDILRKQENNGAYTPVALPVSQKIVSGGTGMTKAKIIAAKAIFRRNEADEKNGEELYMAYNADMLTQILSDTTLTSADFMAGKMLQEGAVAGKWLGFNWIPYEEFNVTGSTATAVAWSGTAAHFGTGISYNVDIGPRRDKNNTIQISVLASYGSGRANERKVVAVDFDA